MTLQITSASGFNSIKNFYASNPRIMREPRKVDDVKISVPIFIRYIAVQLMCKGDSKDSRCKKKNSNKRS